MMRWIIADLDGSIANIDHRVPLALAKDWDAFNEKLESDSVNVPIRYLLNKLHENCNIVIMTGRQRKYFNRTAKWLYSHDVRYDAILMRGDNDRRPDVEVKRDMYNTFIAYHPRAEILFVVEDRDRVVEMWRSLGLTCLQCAKGQY